MVDVSPKQSSKGNVTKWPRVISVAKIAGISVAKHTSSLVPLWHNTPLHVRGVLTRNPLDFSMDIEAEASSTGKTGVEMEAMTAVSVAGLTVHDMCKAASKAIRITDIQLESKTVGRVGTGPGRSNAAVVVCLQKIRVQDVTVCNVMLLCKMPHCIESTPFLDEVEFELGVFPLSCDQIK